MSSLQQALALRPTEQQVESLRRQVRVLQAVGYNSVEVEEWEEREGMGKLETLLLEKNKKVDHELTLIKVRPPWLMDPSTQGLWTS